MTEQKLSPKGLQMIKHWEGLRLRAYQDAGGIWTIGYGHTSHAGAPTVTPELEITPNEAEQILKQDIQKHEKRVNALVKVALTQRQFDALVSFDFNTGALHRSTLLKRLNAGNYNAVSIELMRWVYAGGERLRGLERRRAAEVGFWMCDKTSDLSGKAHRQPPPKRMIASKTGNAALLSIISGTIVSLNDFLENISPLFSNPKITGIALCVLIFACAFIWWDRKQKLEHDLI